MARLNFALAVLFGGFLIGSTALRAAESEPVTATEVTQSVPGCQAVAIDLTSPEVVALLEKHGPFVPLGTAVTQQGPGTKSTTQRLVSTLDPTIVVGVSCSASCTNPSQCKVYGCDRVRYTDGTYGCSACSCITQTGQPCGGQCTCTKLSTDPNSDPEPGPEPMP